MWIFCIRKSEANIQWKKYCKINANSLLVNLEWRYIIIILNSSPTEADKLLKNIIIIYC